MPDLDTIIEDSITDAELPLEEPSLDASDSVDEVVEPSTTADDIAEPAAEATPTVSVETAEVSSPATKTAEKPAVDDFDKKYGLQQNSASGRENRIPYSRVKKIVSKAEAAAKEGLTKEWQPKYTDLETKYKELEPKFKDYEERLIKVGEFEQEMMNDPAAHLTKLAQNIPAYARILAPLFNQNAQQGAPEASGTTKAAPVEETMPQPDQKLTDGSMVYSMDGLAKLMEWHGKQVEGRVTKQVEARYAPIESRFQAQARIEAIVPKVQAQIEAARKWDNFTENEPDIVKALQANPALSLEGAYQQVVFPKIRSEVTAAKGDRAKLEQEIRAQVIKELKQTPRSTSTAATQSKAAAAPASGNRSLEDVIADSIKGLK